MATFELSDGNTSAIKTSADNPAGVGLLACLYVSRDEAATIWYALREYRANNLQEAAGYQNIAAEDDLCADSIELAHKAAQLMRDMTSDGPKYNWLDIS